MPKLTVASRPFSQMRWYRHRQKEGHCCNHWYALDLEAKVWVGVARILQEPAQLAEGYEAALAEQAKIQAHAREHLQTLRRNLGRLDNRQAGLVRIYADGDITRQEYLAQRAEIDRERAELTAKVKEHEASLAEAPTRKI